MKKYIGIFCLIVLLASFVSALDSFDYYIQGENQLLEFTPAENYNAIGSFNNAISLDPEMAQAYAGLAQAYAQKYEYFDNDDKWYQLTLQMADKAISVDSYVYDLPEVHEALISVYSAKGEKDKAQKEYDTLIQLYPNYSQIYSSSDKIVDETAGVGVEKISNGSLWLGFSIIILFLLICGFWIWMIIDVIRRPMDNKFAWVLIVLILGFIGALIYFFTKRKNSKSVGKDKTKRKPKEKHWQDY
jgi:tetratricopeptide (TPR) repeat protein